MSFERVIKEYRELNANPIENCGVTIGLINEGNYNDWKITMSAPKDSWYKGGLFHLNAHFPDKYPNEPPEVYFVTPIYHLNVNPRAPRNQGDEPLGHICISTLNWWKSEYKMKEVLYNIYLLFYCFNSYSGYGVERIKEYNEDGSAVFEEKAKYFTKKYANPKRDSIEYDRTQDWDFNL